MDVPLHPAQQRPRLLGPAHIIGFVGKIEQHSADRNQALAHLRGEIALLADRLEDVVVASGAIAALVFRLENVVRNLIDLGADALQDIGGPVDDGIEQIHHDRFPGHGG